MSNTTLSLGEVNKEEAVNWGAEEAVTSSITAEVMKLYAHQATKTKGNIDELAASVNQRQDKMRLINEIISEINNLTDDKNALNLTAALGLQDKISLARKLGAVLPDASKCQFTPTERDRLIENLHLTADGWDKENKSQTQKMEICIKELDRYMMILKEVSKDEKQTKQQMAHRIGPG